MKNNNNSIEEKKLKKVSAGDEPEEFEWKTKGYVTLEKDHIPNNDEWAFSVIGNVSNYLKKIFNRNR